jgi:tRNA-dihydrouridine synthase
LNKSLEWKGEKLGLLEMRRHYSSYFKGYPHFKAHRTLMVSTNDSKEIVELLHQLSSFYPEHPELERLNSMHQEWECVGDS